MAFISLYQHIRQFTGPTTAITFESTTLSYDQLHHCVATLAKQLTQAGVKEGDFVAVLANPGAEITLALLAITAVGAVYTPLDPAHPNQQLVERAQILGNITVALFTHGLAEKAAQVSNNTLLLDAAHLSEPTDFTYPVLAPNSPACLFFTSGTTGKPKAVIGSQDALIRSILEPASHLAFTPEDTLNSMARYAWSISMLELLAPLVCGGRSLILDRQKALDLDWLLAQVGQCTAFHCPPALLKNVAEHAIMQGKPQNHIRLSWYGGDVFTPAAINRVQKAFANAQIGTAYGCTEIFGLSHIFLYPKDAPVEKVCFGFPVGSISQTLDGDSSLSALWLSGPRVMLGYWQNGAIAPIAATEHGQYATGDFVRQHGDGELEFIERRDSQVKIRGIRIELGEIDTAISRLAAIKDCITLALDQDGDKRLSSYIATRMHDEHDIRQFLKAHLPEYMVPADIFIVDDLPVTENFKIDRKALSKMKKVVVEDAVSLSDTMQTIAGLWKKYAKVPTTDPDANFFDSGGNSLGAAVLASAMTRSLKVKFDVADIYAKPTIRQLANKLDSSASVSNQAVQTHYRASYGQTGLFFRELFDGSGKSITCTRYFIRQDRYDRDLVQQTLLSLVERHPTLRSYVQTKKGELFISVEDKQHLDINKLRVIDSDTPLTLVNGKPNTASKVNTKFNLKGEAYLIRAFIFPLEEGGELLQLTAHHIAADDNATGRLGQEFCQLYNANLAGEPCTLAKANQNYGQFAIDHTKALKNQQGEAAKLALRLVRHLTQSPNPELGKDNLQSVQFPLHRDSLSFAEYVSAVAWSLTPDNTTQAFVFCLHVALKRDSDDAPDVGMYINLVPLFCQCDKTQTRETLIAHITQALSEAIAHSNVPYEMILSAHPKLKQMKRFPFDVYLNELTFNNESMGDFSTAVVPRSFATDDLEVSLTMVSTDKGYISQLDSPVEKTPALIAESMQTFLASV